MFANAASSQFNQDQFNRASASFNKGIEGLSHTFMNYARSQIEDMVTTVQNLLSCRSMEEMTAIQEQFVQQSFDRLVDEASKVAQTTANLAKQTAIPLNDEMENLVEKMRNLGRVG